MKKNVIYVILIGLLLGSSNVYAANKKQTDKRQRPSTEDLQKMKTQRIIKELMLDDQTTAKFTPLYEAYTNELKSCMPERKIKDSNDTAKPEQPKELTDNEIASLMKERFSQERKRLDIQENYYDKFSKILSQKQVMKVLRSERGAGDRSMQSKMKNSNRSKRQNNGNDATMKRQGKQS